MRLYFAIFLFLALSIYFLMHFYIYLRLVSDFSIPSIWRKLIIGLFVFGGTSFIGGEILARQFSIRSNSLLLFGLIWLGAISITLSFLLLSEIFKFIFPSHKTLITFISILLSLIAIIFSLINASYPPRVKELRLTYKSLPPSLKGFKIAQLSDVHLGLISKEKWLKKVVEKVNSFEPDIIVITGDLIDSEINGVERISELLKGLNSKYGVFAVAGNHEIYAGIEKFNNLAERAGFKILNNEKFTINENLEILGIEDDTNRRFENKDYNPEELFKKIDPKRFTIFLSHKPKYFESAASAGVDLQLSGHTHAGQIPPMDLIIFLTFKYPYGLYKLKDSFLYTTSGTGVWGPPMRLFSSSEIVKIILDGN